MVKYVGDGEEQNGLQVSRLNLMDKTLAIWGARLAFNIWDVAGDSQSADHVPIACKDAVAILFMFDLTSRCTLTNIIDWYERVRKWNKTAIPILIGTKFDDFAQLPLEMQWTIVNELYKVTRLLMWVQLAQNQPVMFRWEMAQLQLMEMLTQWIQTKQCMLTGLQKLKEYCQGRSLFSIRYNFCIPTISLISSNSENNEASRGNEEQCLPQCNYLFQCNHACRNNRRYLPQRESGFL